MRKFILCLLLFFCKAVQAAPGSQTIHVHFAGNTVFNAGLQDSIPLTEVLKQVTAHYQVNFMYEERNLSTKKVVFSAGKFAGQTLEQLLTAILQPLHLSWSEIDAKNYSVYPSEGRLQQAQRDSGVIPPVSKQDTAGFLRPGWNLAVQPKDSVRETLNEVKIISRKAVVETKSDRIIYNVANSAMAVGNSIQLLKSAPFVKISSDNTISLQGKNTMILIDNKPVSDASLQNILQTLPAANIAQIELITHPSAKYDGTYGAVINIITKKSQIEGLTGNLAADGSRGKYSAGNINGGLTYKHRGLTLYGTSGLNVSDELYQVQSERVLGTDDVPDVLSNDWRRLSRSVMFSFQAGADLEIGKNQTLGAIVSGGIYHFDGPWTTKNTIRKQGGAIDSVLYTDGTFDMPASTFNYNLNYKFSADSGKNELTVLSTFTPWKRNIFQYFPSVLLNNAGDTLNVPATYETRNITKINLYIAQADYSHTFDQQWKLESGAKFQYTASANSNEYESYGDGQFVNVPEYSNDNRLKESISGVYAILSKDWKSDKLQMGLRVEQTRSSFVGNFDQNYFNAFPNLFYQHNLSQTDNIFLSFKRTINRAPYYELVPYAVFLNRYTVEQGNPLLKPSYDNIYTLGTAIRKMNVSVIYTSTRGMIALFPVRQDQESKLTYFSRRNLDRASDYSVFLVFPLRFNSWWETQNSGQALGYNSARGKVYEEDYSINAFHSDFKSANIFQLSKIMKLEVDLYYWTKYVQDLSRYSGYKNVDAAVLIDVFKGKGQLRLAGNQIVFKRNDFSILKDFRTFSSAERINTDSRRVSVGFTYKFGKTTIKSPEKKLGNEEAMKRL
ncbi:outer membrane beta-barrel family protein [Pedobacter hartonius]|uniref:Outer membrane receptor proteins, mostly Fe transport n=1 Tax=Pedobacter hartonius TaxID=425514 RepID=A0A1H4GB03_9SPHI|nr:outer membrane beta-barrel family protein [Pedobacter hartonius]SEB05872.1 Outer membrane receptor proteins, mostly Fe transport [Pedobacter hartonius]